MNNDKMLPIQFRLTSYGTLCDKMWLDVVFLKDFGVWRKGDKVQRLGLNLFEGELQEYNAEDAVKASVKIKLGV